MAQTMTKEILASQNEKFAGSGGVSHDNKDMGFVPGFLDEETGSVYPSRHADGSPAAVHLIEGLPENLVLKRDSAGRVCVIKATVIAGFIRDGLFFTREQVVHTINQLGLA